MLKGRLELAAYIANPRASTLKVKYNRDAKKAKKMNHIKCSIRNKKGRKEKDKIGKKKQEQGQDIGDINFKVAINSVTSVITLNINSLIAPTKR